MGYSGQCDVMIIHQWMVSGVHSQQWLHLANVTTSLKENFAKKWQSLLFDENVAYSVKLNSLDLQYFHLAI